MNPSNAPIIIFYIRTLKGTQHAAQVLRVNLKKTELMVEIYSKSQISLSIDMFHDKIESRLKNAMIRKTLILYIYFLNMNILLSMHATIQKEVCLKILTLAFVL